MQAVQVFGARLTDLFQTGLSTLKCLSHQTLVQYNQVFRGPPSSSSHSAVSTEVLSGCQEYQLHSAQRTTSTVSTTAFFYKEMVRSGRQHFLLC